ncbi:hypothetical protein OF83DRAFT_1175591 [Amylostereum chailletii]|nr:hypothetical protein OF83DRAFT_1175591 [Amylostereum chailletii]
MLAMAHSPPSALWQNKPPGVDDTGRWRATRFSIPIPVNDPRNRTSHVNYSPGIFYHRKLTSAIREKLQNRHDAPHFHYEPYEVHWQPHGDVKPQRVHSEVYNSEAFLQADAELQASARKPGCTLPRHIVATMWGSDSTHLTDIGDAHIWPGYLQYGNESKYRRSRPTCNLMEHIAYFLSLPDDFKAFATKEAGWTNPANTAFLAHVHRELMHAQLKILLDNDFVEAYAHGIVIECPDGVTRWFYPHIFTYSADYLERVKLATVRDKGQCPCPRCGVLMVNTQQLGTVADMNFRRMHQRVDGPARWDAVQKARRLIYEDGQGINSITVERLLQDKSWVPTEVVSVSPAVDTIRKFSSSVSELKQLAARDYEDLLQCAIPVFEGLLPPEDNTRLLRLLFHAGHWHSLVKLRMHTDDTIVMLEAVTKSLGRSLRDFKKNVCDKYATTELGREQQARLRRAAKQAEKAAAAASTATDIRSGTGVRGAARKEFKSQTATDPFSLFGIGATENNPIDLPFFFHDFEDDPAVQMFPDQVYRHLLVQLQEIHNRESLAAGAPVPGPSSHPGDEPSTLHIIIKANRIYKHAYMTSHYTTYNVRRDQDTIAPDSDRNIVMMLTSPPDSQSENGDTSEDDDDEAFSPYTYARVTGIFHAHVMYTGPGLRDAHPRRVEFLWVRWLEQEPFTGNNVWDSNTLEKARYPPVTHPDAFGFMDPADVLRGCHLMPAFAHGHAHDDSTLGQSYHGHDGEDWNEYYVGRFVDRDMLMRHHWGAGIGHTYAHQATTSEARDCGEGHSLRYTPDHFEDDELTSDLENSPVPSHLEEAPRLRAHRRRCIASSDLDNKRLQAENTDSNDGSLLDEDDVISIGEDSELDDIDEGFD